MGDFANFSVRSSDLPAMPFALHSARTVSSMSSLRTQGPILRDLSIRQCGRRLSQNFRRWLWVPAFAGTTVSVPRSFAIYVLAPFARAAALNSAGGPVRAENQA